ncbi:hypothetical protein F4808DRAFT_310293 [Astrocystis sublimbata]|nr:hypothetical protein F4808DRAFT_310293 [Astrocystis sublimbata]
MASGRVVSRNIQYRACYTHLPSFSASKHHESHTDTRGSLPTSRQAPGASSCLVVPFRKYSYASGEAPSRDRRGTPRADGYARPLGRLVAEHSPVTPVEASAHSRDARITNCLYAASYTFDTEGEGPLRITVPGRPPAWRPPPLPCQVPVFQGNLLLDRNGTHFPDHPMLPAVQALFTMNEAFDPASIDIMGCASSLGDLLRYTQSEYRTFRFNIEMIGNTLFLTMNRKRVVIPVMEDYSRSFLSAFTSSNPADIADECHQRIVSYDFGGLKCLVRFECDGYLPDSDGHDIAIDRPQLSRSHQLSDSIRIHQSSTVVPQETLLEIKTRYKSRGNPVDKGVNKPRLWIRQVPYFVTAYHKSGLYEPQWVKVQDFRGAVYEWETSEQESLKKYATLLHQLITEVRRSSHLKLEVYRAGKGPLQLRERADMTEQTLPASWRNRWAATQQPSAEVPSVGYAETSM